jgi:hypothetical protein
VHGPKIFARSLSVAATPDKFGNRWQYHSRSDRHSKIGCWGILFDLLLESSLLRKHFADGVIGFGVNHEMRDFKTNRKKNLDLVVCSPGGDWLPGTLADLVDDYAIELDPAERSLLKGLPVARRVPVGMVKMALEAKACMTEHVKAIPRLYDELNSSHQAIHGAVAHAIAVGFAVVNLSETFVSTDRNKVRLTRKNRVVTTHKQPHVAERVVEKLREIPRRDKVSEEGFDALGIVAVECRNDGSPVEIWPDPPAPQPGDIFEYDAMIRRVADAYEARNK